MINPTLRPAEEVGFPGDRRTPSGVRADGVSVLLAVLTLCLFPKITLDPKATFWHFVSPRQRWSEFLSRITILIVYFKL